MANGASDLPESTGTVSLTSSTSAINPAQTFSLGSTDNSGSSSGSKTNVGAIMGSVVGGVVGLAVLAFAAFFVLRRRARSSSAPSQKAGAFVPRIEAVHTAAKQDADLVTPVSDFPYASKLYVCHHDACSYNSLSVLSDFSQNPDDPSTFPDFSGLDLSATLPPASAATPVSASAPTQHNGVPEV